MTPRSALRLIASLVAGWTAVHWASPAVRGWSRPRRVPVGVGPLHTTAPPQPVVGTATVVLLHGIVASGRSYGRSYETLPTDVVVPDLLGFGGSMEADSPSYDRQAHVAALRRTLDGLPRTRPYVIVGHSMGAVAALHLAAAMPDVLGVVAVSAPLYDSPEEGMDRIGGADPLAGLVAYGDVAERICGWMCAHRRLARRLWPLLGIQWPWPVAADGVLHTWPAYKQSLDALVLESDYVSALQVLQERAIPVVLLNGTSDDVPVPGRASALAARYDNVSTRSVAGAGHALPLSHAPDVIDAIQRLLDGA